MTVVSLWKIPAGKYRPEMSTEKQTLCKTNFTSKTTDGISIFAGSTSAPLDLQDRKYYIYFVRDKDWMHTKLSGSQFKITYMISLLQKP